MTRKLVVALIALRVSARNPGELSALDRGILRLVSPGQAAMSYVARAITGSRWSGPRFFGLRSPITENNHGAS